MRGSAAACAIATALLLTSCGGGREGQAARAPSDDGPKDERKREEPSDPSAELPKKTVRLYFASASSETLVGEDREIFDTASAVDRAKQILSELLSGPTGTGMHPAVPAGTQLKQVYLLPDGTAYANFSEDLTSGIAGGSSEEILAIYSIVDSVVLNVPEIRRLAILVDGRSRATLAGHIDLRKPFLPDRSLLRDKSARSGDGNEV